MMFYPRLESIFVVAAIAAFFTLGITTSIFTTFPSGQQQAEHSKTILLHYNDINNKSDNRLCFK